MTTPLIGALLDTLRFGGDDAADLTKRWAGVSTAGLVELAAFEGASAWLFRRLRSIGALEVLPADLQQALRTQAFQASGKVMRVEQEAVDVIGLLSAEGFPVIAMKGIARRALAPRYPYLDARASNDVDVLLPHDRVEAAQRFLLSRGYELAPTGWDLAPEHHHMPGIWGQRRIVIELHRSTSPAVPPQVAWERSTRDSEAVSLGGISVVVPSCRELAWNAIAHGVGDSARGFRLQNFLEVSALVAGGAQLDFTAIRERAAAGEAFDPEARARDRALVTLRWLDASLGLVASAAASREQLPRFDLGALLDWRVKSFDASRRLGRRFAERMLDEGARALIGLPVGRAPAGAGLGFQLRRAASDTASRLLFGAWRATRRGRRDPL